jgi:hypothetical protein
MPRGRGRLSSIDLLPEEAEPHIVWAMTELKERRQPAIAILAEFNARLADLAIKPVSKSAFNRASLRLSRMASRLGEVREIAGVLASKFETGGDEDLTLLLSETIKALTFEMLENAGELKADGFTAEMLMNAGRALKNAEDAKRISADVRKRIEVDFAAKAGQAVDKVAKAKGLSSDTVADIKAQILGIRRDGAPK